MLLLTVGVNQLLSAQFRAVTQWTADGNSFYKKKDGDIVKTDVKTMTDAVVVTKAQLTPVTGKALSIASFSFSSDNSKLLIFTNTGKVWRYRTRGDYWLLDLAANRLTQIGRDRASQSLMYAKLSPDNKTVAYVSEHNLFTEDIATGKTTQLTFDGTRQLINGTFDWVYEEEFFCRVWFQVEP